jgi:hypothetical protein
MLCKQCRKPLAEDDMACAHCGWPNPAAKGMYQSSTVLISSGGADLVYRSVEEVPASLRTKLIESTNGCNSATILIADQRGRREISKAIRALPGSSSRRLLDSALRRAAPVDAWLTLARVRILIALVLLIALTTLAIEYARGWH